MIELFEALLEAMRFRGIDPDTITTVDSTVGFIWFKADGNTYYLGIEETEFDLDKSLEK